MNQLLPTLRIARGTTPILRGQAPLPSDRVEGCPHGEAVGPYLPRTVTRYRYVAAITSEIDLSLVANAAFDSWDELALQTYNVATDQIKQHPAAADFNPKTFDKREADDRLDHDARAGASQIAAFLQVLPRVLYMTEFEVPDRDIADRACRSRAFMVGWSKLDPDSDSILAYGAAYPKPNLNERNIYDGLRFHPKWFEEKDNGAVGFRESKLADIRGPKNVRLRQTKGVILGCPAVDLVPAMYNTMTAAALANQLFSETYSTERRNYGYVDNC